MGDFLAEMASHSRERADEALRHGDDILVRARAAGPTLPLVIGERFGLIAEVKMRAPSAGVLATPENPQAAAVAQAEQYAEAGAAAISVLTEPSRFDGDLSHLEAVAESVAVPAMRKDFLMDPIQVAEARASGAGGILLITRLLTDRVLDAMLYAAHHAELFVLIESFDEEDLNRTGAAIDRRRGMGPVMLAGVNTRDLKTLQVDPTRLERLAYHLPAGVPAVAESGITAPEDCAHVAQLGYQMALVGSALMQADDPGAFADELLCAGREAFGTR